jgi:zinc/manganese transport system substrate-binding protein
MALAVAAACRGGGPPPLRVVTLGTVLTEIAQQVGGPQVAVFGLIGPGTDPHTFNPSPSDMRRIADSDLVLASGLNIEAYFDRLVASAGPAGRVVAVGDLLPEVLTVPGPGPREEDPHWWHSIGDMIAATGIVRGELARARPGRAALFEGNAAAYIRRLAALRAWVSAEVSRLPPARRQLVTSHDAFGYFARDFGFTVHPINGLSTENEADARHLAALVDLVRRDDIRAIFAESSANPRTVENLLQETGARLGGELYADGLGPPGSGAETYEAMYRHNVRTIVAGLLGP